MKLVFACTVSGITRVIEEKEDKEEREYVKLALEDDRGRTFSIKGEPELSEGINIGSALTITIVNPQKTIPETI